MEIDGIESNLGLGVGVGIGTNSLTLFKNFCFHRGKIRRV